MAISERTHLSPKRLETAALKRQEFLYAGMRCIRKLGMRNSTMDEFAAEAGVARVTLYREFGSRKELIRAVTAHRSASFNRRFASRTEHIADLAEKLEAFFMASAEVARRNPVTREIVHGPNDFAQQGSPLHQIAFDLWNPILERAREEGMLASNMDSSAAAEWILMTQALCSRLAVDSPIAFPHLREMIRAFILPSFVKEDARRKHP